MYDVIVVGAGAGGISALHYLLKSGCRNVLVLEGADDVGGVWRDNTYPNCACDVESHLYSLSFHEKRDWSEQYGKQPEIFGYLRDAVRTLGLAPYIRMKVKVVGAEWQADDSSWRLSDSEGQVYRARMLVLACGLFGPPKTLDVPGAASFQGVAFHSAQWRHDVPLEGKTVAVVGGGASAIQFVPVLARTAAKLFVFQRQAGWVIPKNDGVYTPLQKFILRKVPFAAKALRLFFWLRREWNTARHPVGPHYERRKAAAEAFIERNVRDPQLREKLLPKFALGCKRMLRSNEWLPALSAPNVEVVFDRIEEITPLGIRASGVERTVDVIIYATGFRVPNYLGGINIVGPDGKALHEVWQKEGIGAYLGMCMPGFPNLFFMYGPGTNAANSIFYILEAQAKYISRWWQKVARGGVRSFDVLRSAYDRYQKKFIQATEGTVWASGCTNYVVDENGVPRTNWPFRAWYYRLLTFRPKLDDFHVAGADQRTAREAGESRSTEKVAG